MKRRKRPVKVRTGIMDNCYGTVNEGVSETLWYRVRGITVVRVQFNMLDPIYCLMEEHMNCGGGRRE
jgi:hypothetical protein